MRNQQAALRSCCPILRQDQPQHADPRARRAGRRRRGRTPPGGHWSVELVVSDQAQVAELISRGARLDYLLLSDSLTPAFTGGRIFRTGLWGSRKTRPTDWDTYPDMTTRSTRPPTTPPSSSTSTCRHPRLPRLPETTCWVLAGRGFRSALVRGGRHAQAGAEHSTSPAGHIIGTDVVARRGPVRECRREDQRRGR